MTIPLKPAERIPRAGALPDFDVAPFIVIWEVTQACDLLCRHCRACARPRRDPDELTTEEGFALLKEIKRFGDPLFVFTGGDPMKRPDLFDLAAEARRIGLRVALTPSATPLVTRDALKRLKEIGIARLAISLDGPDAESHDLFRHVPGSYQRTLEILEDAHAVGLPLQINTTITRQNAERLSEFAALIETVPGVALWSVFFLVPTGRGRQRDLITAEECESVLKGLEAYSRTVPFDIKTTAAPHHRRVVLQARKERGESPLPKMAGSPRIAGLRGAPGGKPPRGVTDGCGFVFVSHTGEIFPSGFLPLSAGNVRRDSLVETYRSSPLFTSLRDSDRLQGRCGACEFKRLCGGSRARAYAMTGDPLAADPLCAHRPMGGA